MNSSDVQTQGKESGMSFTVSQYSVNGQHLSGSSAHFAICTRNDDEKVRVPIFKSADGVARCRVEGGSDDWKSVALEGGAELTFDKSWGFTTPTVRIPSNSRIFRTSTGQPFMWLADTVWFGLTDRISDAEWKALMVRRKGEGFNVMQVVSGLLPEANFGEKSTLLAGVTSWTADKENLNPKWWDAADTRVIDAVQAGVIPALVGAWSYYILQFGGEKLMRHWHEMIARWGAFPIFWCVVGEIGLMEYEDLFADNMQEEARRIQGLWKSVIAHVRAIDPWNRPITVHPCPAFNESSFEALQGDSEIDFIWLQTGHADVNVVPSTLRALKKALNDSKLPVINSEVCYEGIAGGSPALLQRYLFWTHLLQGAAGHTYGAQGIWAFHDDLTSPGAMWGWIPWQEAVELDGSRQLGLAAKYLDSLGWTGFTPANDSLKISADTDNPFRPWAGRTGNHLVVYFPAVSMAPATIGISIELSKVIFQNLEAHSEYQLEIINPRDGQTVRKESIKTEANGSWEFKGSNFVSPLPTMEDWIVSLSRGNELR